MELNFATSAAGSVRVAVCDDAGAPLKGYGIDDCVPLIGNEIGRRVTWRREGGPASDDVSALRGRAVRLRFEIVDADVFAMRFPASR